MRKDVFVTYDISDELCIHDYGYADDYHNTHWGKGVREGYLLHYVLSGQGVFNGKEVKAGEGFYIMPELLHEYHSYKEDTWSYFFVGFSGEKAGEICKKHLRMNEDGIFKFSSVNALQNLITTIFSGDSYISHTKAIGYFYLLLSEQEASSHLHGNIYVENAKNYIRMNYPKNPTIMEIAQVLNINDRYLYNLFIKHEGIAPKKFLSDIKLKRACELLKGTDQTISEIALSVGFEDVLAFSKFFSKNMQMSPRAYRKAALQAESH